MKTEREARIRHERRQMGLRPWEFSPSQAHGCPNPYPNGTAGHASWARAEAQCAALLANDAEYFDKFPKGST